jgi:hypothetical protein
MPDTSYIGTREMADQRRTTVAMLCGYSVLTAPEEVH